MLMRCWGKDLDQLTAQFPPDEYEPDKDNPVACYWRPADDLYTMCNFAQEKSLWVILDKNHEPADEEVHKTANAVLALHGNRFLIKIPWGYGFSDYDIQYMFEEGNYSCDCNRSLFIGRHCSWFPEMQCGDEIKLLDLQIDKKPRKAMTPCQDA